MSTRRTLRSRLRYRFDTMLARGTTAVILWLFLITGAVVVVTGVILSVTEIAVHGHKVGIIEGIWQNMLRSFEPAAMEADTGWPLRLQSLFVVFFGILVVSSLIGLIASGIDRRVEALRKGRSPVLEEGHTLVLGWSDKVFTVVAELVAAHKGRKESCIVLLAPHDRVDMEDEVRSRVPHPGRSRIVCRSGDPSIPSDLALVSPYETSSVIVLGNNHMDGDAQAIRTVLALMEDERFENLRVVADCLNPDNARALREATDGRALTVASSDLIARITAQACRHTGLGTVFQEILDLEDVNVYFHRSPQLAGKRFGDLVLRYNRGAPIGVRFADGKVQLNPPDDYALAEGDSVVMVADPSDTLELSTESVHAPAVPRSSNGSAPDPSHILIVGWNALAPRIIGELDKWVAPNSLIRVIVDENLVDPDDVKVPGLQSINLHVSTSASSSPDRLVELATDEKYERVVVLCYRGVLNTEEADARTLMTLLHLRQFRRDNPELTAKMTVVTEVLDIRDVELAKVGGADDFIVSERLTALMLSQLAEIPDREEVFADLFEATGSEVCMRPVADYAEPEPGVPFASYVAAAHRSGHLVIGYRTTRQEEHHLSYGITLNPLKSEPVDFQDDDRLIVIVPRD
jgi:K+/H+ antiporter YhaU regulatory subunit KhtT